MASELQFSPELEAQIRGIVREEIAGLAELMRGRLRSGDEEGRVGLPTRSNLAALWGEAQREFAGAPADKPSV